VSKFKICDPSNLEEDKTVVFFCSFKKKDRTLNNLLKVGKKYFSKIKKKKKYKNNNQKTCENRVTLSN
jgi:hypothetical protein